VLRRANTKSCFNVSYKGAPNIASRFALRQSSFRMRVKT
jgi:hypothetical protein